MSSAELICTGRGELAGEAESISIVLSSLADIGDVCVLYFDGGSSLSVAKERGWTAEGSHPLVDLADAQRGTSNATRAALPHCEIHQRSDRERYWSPDQSVTVTAHEGHHTHDDDCDYAIE